MKKNNKSESIFDKSIFKLILTVASTILAVAVVTFSILIVVNVNDGNFDAAPGLLLTVFLLLGLMHVVMYLRERTKVNLIKSVVLLIVNAALGVIVLFAKENPILFSITAGLYCLTIVLSRIFSVINNHSLRNIVLNALIILVAVGMAVGLMNTPSKTMEDVQTVILVECVFIAIVSLVEAMTIALAQLKVKILIKIILSTFSLEVLFGLLVMIVAFSFVFVAVGEPKITSFTDGLWYSFAVVTTIGFGDIVAETPIGRILTVMLGLYGLVVVAVITSIIVNFYNETMGKSDAKELKEIENEEKRNRK